VAVNACQDLATLNAGSCFSWCFFFAACCNLFYLFRMNRAERVERAAFTAAKARIKGNLEQMADLRKKWRPSTPAKLDISRCVPCP
jgi:hypothetical protein